MNKERRSKKKLRYVLIVVIIGFFLSCQDEGKIIIYTYPEIENASEVIEYFDIPFRNDYSNLENFEADEVRDWFLRQDTVAEKYFKSNGFKDFLERNKSLIERSNKNIYNAKITESGDVFYLKDSAEVSLLMKRKNWTGTEKVCFNSTLHGSGNTIHYYMPSHDGKFIAVVVDGDDEGEEKVIFIEVETGRNVGATLKDFKSENVPWINWTPDNESILYTGFPSNEEGKNAYVVHYNLIKNKKRKVFHDGYMGRKMNQEYFPIPIVQNSLVDNIIVYEASASEFYNSYYANIDDFQKENIEWKLLQKESDSIQYYGVLDNGDYYFKQVNKGKFRICRTPITSPDFSNPIEILNDNTEGILTDFTINNNGLYFTRSLNGISQKLYLLNNSGDIELVPLEYPIGNINIRSANRNTNSLNINISGWVKNDVELIIEESTIEKIPFLSGSSIKEFRNIESRILEVESHDGEMVPMTVIKRKDKDYTTKTKIVINAYGAYGLSNEANFNPIVLDFVNQGNVYAVAHVRGGGEKGQKWHEQGMGSSKVNSWKDLNACSEYLLSKVIKNSDRLGLLVESAGGITGGMAINENPELYKAFVGILPTLNPIQIDNFENYNASDNYFEFGSKETKDGVQNLISLDPVLNFDSKGKYPSSYFMIGYKDELIPPSEAAKYVALLQSTNKDENKPYILDVNFELGHEYSDFVYDYSKIFYFLSNEL